MTKYENLKAAFEQLRNPEKAKQMSAYMRDKFEFYGIPTSERRAAYKQLLREEKKMGSIDLALLDVCWADKHREFQYFAMDYLFAMQAFLTFDDIPNIEKFVRSKQWWDSIDSLDGIIGDIGLKDPRVGSLMLEWSTDEDFWVRRVAIDHQLSRKDRTDVDLLEKILVNNFGSKEFFINKAIGWSLREYSKTNPGWVRDFIGRYGDRMSPLSVREASKYI